jgi:hypothetical protein
MASIYRPWYRDKQGTRRQLRKWHIKYRDAAGVVRRIAGFTDKRATQAKAAELERRAARQQVGLIDPFEAHRGRPLAEHVADWERDLLARGNTAKHAATSAARVRRVFAACGFKTLDDVVASKLTKHLGGAL